MNGLASEEWDLTNATVQDGCRQHCAVHGRGWMCVFVAKSHNLEEMCRGGGRKSVVAFFLCAIHVGLQYK